MSKLVQFAKAIEECEKMDRSYNNPGALRWSKFQAGKRNGFAYFKNYEDGWNALLFQLQIACDGRSKIYRSDMTLMQFFRIYSPKFDSNNSDEYAKKVADKLRITINTKIKELIV